MQTKTIRTPKVSIGMPVYNGATFIREALDSLLAQTFEDFELIISDDASTDGTEVICFEYAEKDQRIRFVRQFKNIGGAKNLQFVLDKAIGEYFMFAAQDDWWSPEFIHELTSILDMNLDVVLAFCEHKHVDMNKKIFRKYPKVNKIAISKNENKIMRMLARNSFEKFLLQPFKHGKVNLLYGLIRRRGLASADVIRRWGDYSWGDDLLYVATILRYGNVEFSPKTLWHKTLNPESWGSLPPRIRPPSLLESVYGILTTLIKYIKFSIGIWRVQGAMPGTKKIKTLRRIGFTLFDFLRMVALFIYQVFCIFINRLNIVGRDLNEEKQ